MVKQNQYNKEEELNAKAIRRELKKRIKMRVSGAGVKRLNLIIKNKASK